MNSKVTDARAAQVAGERGRNPSTISLDDRYIEFYQTTQSVFATFPLLESLRYFIFRELVVERKARTWKEASKDWSRPIRRRAHYNGQTLERADVLVLIEGLREVVTDALLPVYQELRARGVRTQLVGTGGAANLPESAYYLYSSPRVFPPVWAKDSWDALCVEMKELRSRPLERSFRSFCANMQGYFDAVETLLDQVKPRIVIVASTQLAGGAGLLIKSRERNILTFLLQHGILQPLYLPIIADRMLTWGDSSSETLIRLGIASEMLLALGSPRHDSIAPATHVDSKSTLYRALSLNEKPTMVFFSNGNDFVRNGSAPHECANWLEIAAAKYSKYINIVVRLHPNEDGSLYKNSRYLHMTKDDVSLVTTLDGCDWVGSLCSTVLYDALLFKKPVWQFYADEWPELADNWERGLALRIASSAQLNDQIERIVSSGTIDSDSSVVTRVFANHGHAAQAISDYVERSLESAATFSQRN